MNATLNTLLAVAAVAATASAIPVVSDVTMTQNPYNTHVTVKYRLTGDPGVVTLDIQTNYLDGAETKWASIGPENMLGFGGDVHQVVQPTAAGEYRTIHWDPETYWPGPPKRAGATRAVVTAWATNAPPDYMIVHLIQPYDVTYYPYVEMVPGGITNIMYKGEYMAFRKIPAKGVVWMAGMPTNHANYAAVSKQHRVLLTDDYYIGVYEVTVAQFTAIDNGAPNTNRKPLTWTNMRHYRGGVLGLQWPSYKGDGTFDYDKSHEVDEGSCIGRLRLRTGLAFDLPTEHQWEYACRAGSPGTSYVDTLPTLSCIGREVANRISRNTYNRMEPDCEGLTGDTATVGSYEPNVWGLYDMLGNVHEVCLDWYESWETLYPDATTVYIDPVGPLKGDKTQLIYRGGHFELYPTEGEWALSISLRSAMWRTWNDVWGCEGARLCVLLR